MHVLVNSSNVLESWRALDYMICWLNLVVAFGHCVYLFTLELFLKKNEYNKNEIFNKWILAASLSLLQIANRQWLLTYVLLNIFRVFFWLLK